MADHLAPRGASVAEIERALRWDPGNPHLHVRLAGLELGAFGGDLDKARRHAEAALLRRPTHAGTWLQLALLADRQEEPARAREALDTALRLDQHNVALRWETALLLLRWGEREPAVEHLRYVIAVDPARRDAAFQLASAILPPGTATTSLLPEEPEALAGLLAGAVRRRDLALAEAAWERRAPLAPPIPDWLQRAYLRLLLSQGQGTAARRVWLAMAPPGSPAGAGGDLMWNGGFEAERIARLGPRLADPPDVGRRGGARPLPGGARPPVAPAGVQQLPDARLRRGPAAGPGPGGRPVPPPRPREGGRLQHHVRRQAPGHRADDDEPLGETRAISGTTADWVPLEARVRIPADTTLVQVRVRREKAPGPEGNLGGKVWLDDVSFTPVAASAAAGG